MFVEPKIGKISNRTNGWIEVICGSMFSGKTEELIRRLNRAIIAQMEVQIFKPTVDNRYHKTNIVSHQQSAIKSTPLENPAKILDLSGTCSVVGIDEAQFFDHTIVEVIRALANQGKRVIVAGLDMDFKGNPFTPMDQIMAVAEYITKVHAICVKCGGIASYSHRKSGAEDTILIGEDETYEALCRNCFYEIK